MKLSGSVLTLAEASMKPDAFYEELSQLNAPRPGTVMTSRENIMEMLRKGHYLIVIDDRDVPFAMATLLLVPTIFGSSWWMGDMFIAPEATAAERELARDIAYRQCAVLLNDIGNFLPLPAPIKRTDS